MKGSVTISYGKPEAILCRIGPVHGLVCQARIDYGDDSFLEPRMEPLLAIVEDCGSAHTGICAHLMRDADFCRTLTECLREFAERDAPEAMPLRETILRYNAQVNALRNGDDDRQSLGFDREIRKIFGRSLLDPSETRITAAASG